MKLREGYGQTEMTVAVAVWPWVEPKPGSMGLPAPGYDIDLINDEGGYLWFVGRTDDVIKSSGYRIGPFEVESALIEHPAVLECAVTGVLDPDRGAVVKATIVLAKGYAPGPDLVTELQEHVKKTTNDQRQDPQGGDQGEGRRVGLAAGPLPPARSPLLTFLAYLAILPSNHG